MPARWPSGAAKGGRRRSARLPWQYFLAMDGDYTDAMTARELIDLVAFVLGRSPSRRLKRGAQ